MSQRVICGTSGNASIAGRGARIASWSADLLHEIGDTTGFGQAPWRTNKGGLKMLVGSAMGFLTDGSTSDTPNFSDVGDCSDGDAVVLTADTGCTYSFTGNLSRIHIEDDVNTIPKITFDFVSNGAVSEAWVTS